MSNSGRNKDLPVGKFESLHMLAFEIEAGPAIPFHCIKQNLLLISGEFSYS